MSIEFLNYIQDALFIILALLGLYILGYGRHASNFAYILFLGVLIMMGLLWCYIHYYDSDFVDKVTKIAGSMLLVIGLCLYIDKGIYIGASPTVGVFGIVAGTLLLLLSNFGVSINLSNSTPYQVFVVHKHVLPKGVGEYIVFDAPNNGRYDKPFVKKIGGVSGDKVTRKGRSYYVNDRYIGDAKEYSRDGKKANLGPIGMIPDSHYFVYLESKDSYDSRYAEIGWVNSHDVHGVAYPIY